MIITGCSFVTALRALARPEGDVRACSTGKLTKPASFQRPFASRAAVTLLSLITFGMPRVLRRRAAGQHALRKGLALLVYLAEMRRPVTRDALSTCSGQRAIRAAAAQIYVASSTMSRSRWAARSSPPIGTRSGWSRTQDSQSISIAFEAVCDAADYAERHSFRRLNICPASPCPGVPEFDDWVYFRREALRSRLSHALERLTRDRLTSGDPHAVVATALRLVALDPYSDANMRHLIAALLGGGDRPAAERHFAAFRARLADDLFGAAGAGDARIAPSRQADRSIRSPPASTARGAPRVASDRQR